MSLINRMLQDLDARAGMTGHADDGPTLIYEDLTPANDPAAVGERKDRRVLLMTITLVLMGTGIALGYLQKEPESGENITMPSAALAQTVLPPVVHAPTLPLARNQHGKAKPATASQQPIQAAMSTSTLPAAPADNGPQPREPLATKNTPTRSTSLQNTIRTRQKQLTADKYAAKTAAESHSKPLKTINIASLAQQHYLDGTAMVGKGRIAEGEDELLKALSLAPDHHQARLTLAGLLIQQGRLTQSQETLRQGLALAPNHAPYARLLARLLMETGDLPQALLVLEDARMAGSGDPQYLAFLAQLYQRSGRHAEAVENYIQALSLAPGRGEWWLGMGISYEALGKTDKALQTYLRAQLNTNLSEALRQYILQRLATLQSQSPVKESSTKALR